MLIEIFFLITCIWMFIRLSSRIKKCERALKELKLKPEVSIEKKQVTIPPLPPKKITPLPKKNIIKKAPQFSFQIPNFIKENWIGFIGSFALVVGAVFFGLTSKIMQHPEARVTVMLIFSIFFLGVSYKMQNSSQWIQLCRWLRSISGAIILFGTLGAGGIKGLQFIESPLLALSFLSAGVLVNILLAMTTPSQAVASLHVLLSIAAFCVAPQAPILLPIGTIIVMIGLLAAYRTKWDFHLLNIILAFTLQNTLWTTYLKGELLPWMHILAIGCSLSVAITAALVHYSKKYKTPKFEVLPFIAHITNWGLLVWNIYLHAQFFKFTPLILAFASICGFILARVAKKKEIVWLYYTDTLIAQGVAISAMISLQIFTIKPIDIALLILIETMIFNLISLIQKEEFLIRVGYSFQLICYVCTLLIFFIYIEKENSMNFIYFRMGVISALSWGYSIFISRKNYQIDHFQYISTGEKRSKNSVSIMNIAGTIFYLAIYFLGFNSMTIQAITLFVIIGMGMWRKKNENLSWNISFVLSLITLHIMNWALFASSMEYGEIPSLFSRYDTLGIVIVDGIFILGNFLQFNHWKKNLSHIVVYGLAIQIALTTYLYTKDISLLIPGVLYLGYSLFSLELSRLFHKINESLIYVGLVYLFGFACLFITIHLQIEPIWKGISLRRCTEIFGIASFIYWIAFLPREKINCQILQILSNCLIEAILAFTTLCVFVEIPEASRPLIWILIAIGLLIGSLKYKWEKRLFLYSWIYFIASIIHIAFVTYTLTMPKLFLIEKFNIVTFLVIIIQFYYSYIVQTKFQKIKKQTHFEQNQYFKRLFQDPSISVLLPVFIGVGLMLAFNYEKTILTLLWVGLISIYLSLGLLTKSKISIQIAMSALALCCIRLIIFDLIQSDLSVRALVFVGVGTLMLGISIIYKKFKHRIEVHEIT